jgi:hypothetical protein
MPCDTRHGSAQGCFIKVSNRSSLVYNAAPIGLADFEGYLT